MNWDWEKLQGQRKRREGIRPPDLGDVGDKFKQFKSYRMPGGGKWLILLILVVWIGSGFYIVQPDEVGVVQRFGAYDRTTTAGPHIHWPFPVETVTTPRVTEVRRVEVGFRSVSRAGTFEPGQVRLVPDESLMLTGDENIVDVQFIVQYQIKNPEAFLFNVAAQPETVKNVAEAAMREVIGNNKIDSALTTGKVEIQNETQQLMQQILDRYTSGIRVVAVQLQDVHPPKEVIDAFKDVASAREDKSRFINEAEAYRNDILPKARGQAAVVTNAAEAFKQSKVLEASGGAEQFLAILAEYRKAKDVTRTRLYLETIEKVLSSPDVEKILMSGRAAQQALPLLPLESLVPGASRKEGGQ